MTDGATGQGDDATTRAGTRIDEFFGGRQLTSEGLKALAHPLRVRMLRLLSLEGPSTASELGRLVGESSGTTSYHLRKLAEQGLIEEAPEVGTGRDRYWRRTEGPLLINSVAFKQHEDTAGLVRLLESEFARARMAELSEWQEHNERWPAEWREGSQDSSLTLHLTVQEMTALTEEVVQLIVARMQHHTQPAEGTRPVHVGIEIFPLGRPPAGEDTPGG